MPPSLWKVGTPAHRPHAAFPMESGRPRPPAPCRLPHRKWAPPLTGHAVFPMERGRPRPPAMPPSPWKVGAPAHRPCRLPHGEWAPPPTGPMPPSPRRVGAPAHRPCRLPHGEWAPPPTGPMPPSPWNVGAPAHCGASGRSCKKKPTPGDAKRFGLRAASSSKIFNCICHSFHLRRDCFPPANALLILVSAGSPHATP